MARIRTIRPEFPQSETMGHVSRDARLVFIMLWTVADDAGRLRGNPRMLSSILLPFDDDSAKRMDGWLAELASVAAIRRYVVDGQSYIDIPNWLKHQRIEKPSASRLPAFEEGSAIDTRKVAEDSPNIPGIVADASAAEGKGKEGKGRKTADLVGLPGFDRFWQAWPAHPRKVDKRNCESRWRAEGCEAIADRIVADVEARKRSPDWTKQAGEFIPGPAVYLNQRRWEAPVAVVPSREPLKVAL